MNQRLIWNFEFLPKQGSKPVFFSKPNTEENIKWEIRYFWSKEQIISLNPIDNGLLDISQYDKKQREDIYYLLSDKQYNIKKRHNELIYKPQLKQSGQAVGYGPKIKLDPYDIPHEEDDLTIKDINKHIQEGAIEIRVKKTAFIHTFNTKPKIKCELARIEVRDDYFFSLCIEGRSLAWVEAINKQLLSQSVSCDYVSFLKKITAPC